MACHCLKIQDKYLTALVSGAKTFEIRKNDRNYREADLLKFVDFNGLTHTFKITYIHSGLGLKGGYVAMSVIKISRFN